MRSGGLFSTAQLTVSRLLSPTELACAICWNLSVPSSRVCLGFWSHGLFVLITHRNKDRAEAVDDFGTISSPGQENKLTSIRGPVSLVFWLSLMQNLFLHFPLGEWQAWQYFKALLSIGCYVMVMHTKCIYQKTKICTYNPREASNSPLFFLENAPFTRSAPDGRAEWTFFFWRYSKTVDEVQRRRDVSRRYKHF